MNLDALDNTHLAVVSVPSSTSASVSEKSVGKKIESLLENLDDCLECPICLDTLTDTHIVPECQHRFCGGCIKESLRKCNNECPSCRVTIPTRRSLRPDHVFDAMVEEIIPVIQAADSSSNQNNDNNATGTIQSMEMLQKPMVVLGVHFRCMLCFSDLDESHLFSKECMHRFCVGCITGFLQKSKDKDKCPCCLVPNRTTFQEDRLFGHIAKTISTLTNLVMNVGDGSDSPNVSDSDGDGDGGGDRGGGGWSPAENDAGESELGLSLDQQNKTREIQVAVKVGDRVVNDLIARINFGGGDNSPYPIFVDSGSIISTENDERIETALEIVEIPPEMDEIPPEMDKIPPEMDKIPPEKVPSSIVNDSWCARTNITAPAKNIESTTQSQRHQMQKIRVAVRVGDNVAMLKARIPSMLQISSSSNEDSTSTADNVLQQRESADVEQDNGVFSVPTSQPEDLHNDMDIHSERESTDVEQEKCAVSVSPSHPDPICNDRNIHSKKVAIPQKFATGSCFVVKESQKYGRIVGYDGTFCNPTTPSYPTGLYQIYYPQDGKCDSYTEADFEKVQFRKEHKRPSKVKSKNTNRNIHAGEEQAPRCPMCQNFFSSNRELNNGSGRTPIQSQKCSHVICVDCIQSRRIRDAGQTSIRHVGGTPAPGTILNLNKLRSTVDCPFCFKQQAFNAIEPTVCFPMCQMVSMYHRMSQTLARENHSRRRNEQDRERDREMRRNKEKARRQRRKERKRLERAEHLKRQKREEKMDQNCTESSSGMVKNVGQKESKPKRNKSEAERKARSGTKDKERSRSKSSRSAKRLKCATCKKEKNSEKFTSKQLQRVKKGKQNIYCRRCEEKGVVQKQLGSGSDKVSTALFVSKEHGSKPKFLTTLVPWHSGKALKKSPLPSELTLDGYTRESWGRLSNNDLEQEKMWKKGYLWSTNGEKLANFLSFLRQHKKSAFGTFLLSDGTDGFFVVPFDQRPLAQSENVFRSKYILGLGLVGDKSSTTDNEKSYHNVDTGAEAYNEAGCSGGHNTLRNLLAAEARNRDSLAMVPKGSVKIVKKLLVPEAPKPNLNGGVSDWFREKIHIREDGESEDESESVGGQPAKDTAGATSIVIRCDDLIKTDIVKSNTTPELKNTAVDL